MKLESTIIPGCYEIEFTSRQDTRGSFVKTFHATVFRELGLESGFSEGFYSVSHQNVLRGMHFQLPPADAAEVPATPPPDVFAPDDHQKRILMGIGSEGANLDGIIARSELPAEVVMRELTMMTLRGMVKRVDGQTYIRKS